MIISEKIDLSLRRSFTVVHVLGSKIDDLFPLLKKKFLIIKGRKKSIKQIREERKRHALRVALDEGRELSHF